MRSCDIYLNAFDNIRDKVHVVAHGLDAKALTFRPHPEANSIAWLLWHLTRVQDDHVADAMGVEQQWLSAGFAGRFGLPFSEAATGYGHSPAEVGAVQRDRQLLIAYHDAVHRRTRELLADLDDPDFDRIVDESWDPPVTLGVRLVSVLGDDLQHVGQADYLRGLYEARKPE